MNTYHVLPGKKRNDSEDEGWFHRMNQFQRKETLKQVVFRDNNFPGISNGPYSKNPDHLYPHILPPGNESRVYYGDYDDIKEYFDESGITFHTESLNLKSSQVCCINLLFPLKKDISKATAVFKLLFPNLQNISKIEFEYTGDDNEYRELGEPESGKRGQNRTSIDAAVFWKDKSNIEHISFIEWKYTEPGFGGCSAFNDTDKDEVKLKCLNQRVLESPEEYCLVTTGSPLRNRTYWKLMEKAGIDINLFTSKEGCPFRGPFYQLMRQYLLAYLVTKNKPEAKVEVVSMAFENNASIHKIPRYLKDLAATQNTKDIITLWNSIIKPPSLPLGYITVEKFVKAVDDSGAYDESWRNYIKERYGL
jgi:hypothetical protein